MPEKLKNIVALLRLVAILLLLSGVFPVDPVTLPDELSVKTDFADQILVSSAKQVESAAESEPVQIQLLERVRLRYTPLIPAVLLLLNVLGLHGDMGIAAGRSSIRSFRRKLYLIYFPLRAGPRCL